MAAVVDERALMHLNVGDFVAVMTHHMKDGKMHWTLGSVETPPYLRDVEIRLWEKQRVEYYNEEETPSNPETAELMKRIAQVKDDLQKSIAQSEDLTQQLRDRRAAIMQQIAEADQYVQESNAVRNAARDDVESIPDRHWQELKSYRIPPKMVSVVIRAVMLLLSEDEARTWPQMQRVLRDFNFKRRITGYDPEQQLSPERRDYILQECVSKKSFRYDRAMQGSVAVGPIYYWVLAQLDCGEAQSQKDRVDKEKAERQKELREVLKQISEQQKRITEYQELMDDLDDQLRMCNQHNDSSMSRSRRRSVAGGDRYADSFAAREGKDYLKAAFFTWKPTDRVIIVLRKNIVSNFNGVTTKEQEEGYNLSDPQIRQLDEALMRRQQAVGGMSDDDDGIEDDMFRQDKNGLSNAARNDEDIMKERELQAAQGGAVPANEVKARLQRRFEGKNWQRVLDRKRDAIEAAFSEESAECLAVPEYYISIEDLTIGSLIVDFTAQHDGRRSTEELQSEVNEFGYPKVLALYEEDDEEAEAGPEHQMKFGGDCWAAIAPAHRKEIEEAFLKDTSAATGAKRKDIEVQDIRVEEGEGLTVDYSVADKSLDPEQVQEQVDAYSYPEVWALYQQLAGLDEAGPTHQVRFRGERWADIMQDNEEAIKAAFAEDTAEALGIWTRQVKPEEMRYEGGLTVPYTICGCSLDDDEVDQKAEDYGYPKTWALYDRLVAEAVGADYQKAFDGEHWETVLQAARPEVSEAFCTDTANAVRSAPGQVDPRSVDTDQDRLLVSYNVGDSQVRAEEVREDTRDYPYPEVWALYQQVVAEEAEGTSNLSQRFDGEAWEAINDAIPEQVRQAFLDDVSAATGVDPQRINVHDVKTSKKGMTVEYGITREKGESAHVMRKAAKDSQYPTTWALYEENKDKCAAPRGFGGAGERESGILERRFEGDDWDIVVDGCPEELSAAFRKDAARTLGVPLSHVRIISTEIGSLIVKYQIKNPPGEDDEIREHIDADEFPEVMALYRRRLRIGEAGEEGGRHKQSGNNLDSMPAKSFVGEEWPRVLENNRDNLERAFQKDTAEALGVAPEQVEVKKMGGDDYTLEVDYAVRDCPADAEEAQRIVEDYAYPSVWDLYPSEEDAGKYEKTFSGAAWEGVVAEREQDVKKAFQRDVAGCLNAKEADIDVRSVRATPEGLAVRYNVSNEQCENEKVEEMCASYGYPKTWALYEEEGEKDWVITSHQVGFDGDDWVYVVRDKLPELQAAFIGCTAELFCLRMENVRDAKFSVGSLIVDFQLKHPAELTEDDVNKELNICPYEPVWELYGYHPWNPEETMQTTHEVGFEGTGWATVLAHRKEELEACFQRDTAIALQTQPEDVAIDSVEYTEECLLIKTTVTHHVFQDNELMQEQLSRFPYDEVWALYEEDPNEGWTTSSHQVGFDGDDWEYVASAQRQALETAFRSCTGEALDLRDDYITNLVLEASESALLATFNLKHPEEQSEAEVNQRLADCDYMPVWDLYIDHPYNPDEVATTTQEVGFEGDEWDKVVKTQPEQLREAIMLDTADALDVTPNDVTNIKLAFKNGDLLLVTMDVEHPVLQDEELMKEQLGRCPYERVWALYEDAPITPIEERESGILERRFEGDDWDIVVDGCPEELSAAFRKDAARTLGVPLSHVRIISTEIGSLIVKYQIKNPPGEDDEIREHIDADEFPEVMALYRRRLRIGEAGEEGAACKGRGLPADDTEDAGAHRKDFPGDNWEECVHNSRADIAEAFQRDTAAALGVAPEQVEVRSMRTDEEAMHIGYDVAEPPAKEAEKEKAAAAAAPSEEEVKAKTENYAYPSVWVLYQDETITTAHALSFEARHWGFVVRRRRWELARAISDDSAEATHLDAESVVDMRMEAHEENLAVTVYIQHLRTTSAEEIDQNLSDAPFERVWALYELVAASSDLVKKFDGARWPEVEAEHRAELKRAFAEDTAKNMHVSRLEVEVLDMTASADQGLVVTYVVRGSSMQDNKMEKAARQGTYPSVWRLYGGESAGQRDFDGAAWEDVLAAKHAEVGEAFREDAANAIEVPQDAVEVYQVTADEAGLHVQYGIRPIEGASDDEAQAAQADRLQHYDYPRLRNLYEESQGAGAGFGGRGDRESGELQRVFEGDDWDLVLEGCPEDANDAFRKGVADSVQVPKSDVVVLKSSLGSLIMDYKVRNCDYEDDEINAKVGDHDFPELMALYRARVRARDEGESGAAKARGLNGPMATSQHQVGFDGEDWPYALKTNQAAIQEAFAADSAEQLGCAPDQIQNIRVTIDSQMLVEFDVEHPEAQTEDEVDEHLKNCSYERVWELYGVHPYDDNEKVTTEHDVGFEGEDWDYVVKNDREELELTFKAATGNAITVPASDVNNLKIEPSDDGIVITCHLTHNANRSREELQEELKRYPYDEMWALYRTRPYDDSEKVTTSHELTFEGDAWNVVCEVQGEALRRAVVEDTAAALNVENEDVIEVKNTSTPEGLVTRVKVRHSPLQDNELIQEELARCEYEHVWALYESSVESRLLSKNFPGAQWPERMEEHAAEVASAFRIDTSNMLNLPPRFVEVKGTQSNAENGLTVEYTVLGEWFKEEEIEQRSAAYAYPEVWKCYQEDGAKVPTDYVKTFPGTTWESVAEARPHALKRAFKGDTADALPGVKRDEVEVTGMTASDEELCVTFTVPTAIGEEAKAKADAAIQDYPYPCVWELYQDDEKSKGAAAGPRSTTLQDCGFEGEDWDYTWENKREEVQRAFASGVADAIGVEPEDVTDVNMEKTADGMILGASVRHPLSQEYEWIQAALRDHPFKELWLLYETRPYDPNDLVDTEHTLSFEGGDWAAVMEAKHTHVLEAVRKDTAEALALEEEAVLDVKPDVSATGLKVVVVVRHSPLHDDELIQEELSKYEYPRVWALYEQVGASSQGYKHFDGANWAEVLKGDNAGVTESFRQDTAAALNVEPTEVEVCSMSADDEGLKIQYKVNSANAPAKEVESALQTYPYPTVWDHYRTEGDAAKKQRAGAGFGGRGDRESGELQRVFEGDDWDLVLEGCPEDANDAFRKGVADSVQVPKSDVVVLKSSLGSLIMDYKVRNCDYEDDEINAKVGDHDFPELMALYRARVRARDEGESGAAKEQSQVIPVDDEVEAELPAGYARVALSVIFEGELWEHVVKHRLQKLTDAFRADTASAVGAKLSEIHIRELVVSAESVMVHFSAAYHESIDEADLREKVDEHPYEDVWALYDEVEDEMKNLAATVMVKRFDGIDWDLALETHPGALEAAFREDTADVLQTSADHVTVDSMATGSLIVHFRVSGIDLPVEKITTLVDNYAYPKVWALYISRDNEGRRVSAQVSNARGSRKTDPLAAEEGVQSEESVTYLRKALADARRERDMYMEQAEKAEEVRQTSQRKKCPPKGRRKP